MRYELEFSIMLSMTVQSMNTTFTYRTRRGGFTNIMFTNDAGIHSFPVRGPKEENAFVGLLYRDRYSNKVKLPISSFLVCR
jgi:hypothetical protein